MSGSHHPQQQPAAFSDWLTGEMRLRGYDIDQRGEQARFARDADLHPGILSRLLKGGTDPDIRTARIIAQALNYPPTRVLIAAGLLPTEEERGTGLTKHDHLKALTDGDSAAGDAVIAVLRATGHWP